MADRQLCGYTNGDGTTCVEWSYGGKQACDQHFGRVNYSRCPICSVRYTLNSTACDACRREGQRKIYYKIDLRTINTPTLPLQMTPRRHRKKRR